MNPAEVALAELDVLLDEQQPAAAPPVAPAAIAACPTRRRVGNPTNEAPASLPEAAAAALKRRREQQPAQQPAQLRCSKRVRVAPPVAEFAAGAEVEALWEGKWFPGVVAEVVVEQDVSYEVAWADGYYQNRIRAVSRSGEKLVRKRGPTAAPLTSTDPAACKACRGTHRKHTCGKALAGNPKRPAQSRPPVVTAFRPTARPPPPRGADDWCIVGAHVQDFDDSTVRGIITHCPGRAFREVTTTTGTVVMRRAAQLTRSTLTAEEAALCVRPVAMKDYMQARIDGAVRFSFDGREFKNHYTCADGTPCRQFEVTATHARCALCGDAHTWPLKTGRRLLDRIKMHCGQMKSQLGCVQQHLDRLVQSVATADEAKTVLGVSHAQVRRLATAAAAGCLIVREVVAEREAEAEALSEVQSAFRTTMRTTQWLPSDAALEAMTGTQLRKLMARRGVGRGPQDRKEDFIDKLKARAAGETYVNKPNPYKRRAPTRRLSAKTADLRLGSRVLAFGKRGTITDLPGMNGWWRVRLDGDSLTRSVRAGDMRALDGAVAPPRPSANELKLSEELAQRENEGLKAPRGPSLPEAADDATAQERNRRLAEEIGAPVCLWGAADVRRERDEAMDPEAKRPRTEAPWARWDQSSENDSAAPRPAPPMVAALPPPPRAPVDSEAVTAAAPPPPRPPAPRTAPQDDNTIDLTREDSEDGWDPPTPPGDDGYSSSSSDCSVESVGGQYVPQPPGPAPPNRTWDTRRGAWVDAVEEFDAWLAQNVPRAWHARLRAAADSLADLRCCDIDDLDDALGLSQWPEPARRRFMDACSSL